MQGRDSVDLINDFAFPLPIEVLIELLGLPHADRDFLLQCSMDLARFMQSPPVAPASEGAVKVHEAIAAYFQDLLAARGRNPSCDLLSKLIEIRDNGDRLTEFELIDICGLLFIAGHETTVNLIGNGVLTLLRHPGDLRRVQENPGLLHLAVEELLRYESPVQRAGRIAGADMQMGNKTIPRGAVVSAVIGAANRDPARFHEPDRLDLARRNNCHLALGSGERYCLGAPLARLEAQIGIGSLILCRPGMELAARPPAWLPSAETRGLRELYVIF
jgi:cytochrome P450